MPLNTGFADTDIRIGVDEQLLIATVLIAGLDTPSSASPWPTSLSVQFETPIELFVISTTPFVRPFVPNLSVQYCTEPVEPWANVTRAQAPRFGAVIDPLLSVSVGRPKLSS